MYKKDNPFLELKREYILNVINTEYNLYKNTLKKNLIKIEKELKNRNNISNEEINNLFNRYGVPVDIITEMVIKNKNLVRR